MLKKLLSVAMITALTAVVFATSALAVGIMPNLASVPTGWSTDRYDPASFTNVGPFAGRTNVLGISIAAADGAQVRPGGYSGAFYNTQGRAYDFVSPAGMGSVLSADLYIPASWASGDHRRTDIWGVMVDGSNAPTNYPIIGFTNYGGVARLRVFNITLGGWFDLATPITYDAWTKFSIEYAAGNVLNFYVNGVLVNSQAADPSTVAMKSVIMQAYNFYDNTIVPPTSPSDYTANWANSILMVDTDGQAADGNCGSTTDTAFSTITSAVAMAAPGDTLKVCPSTYNESPAIPKSLTVESTGGRDVTTIQLNSSTGFSPYGAMYLSGAGNDITLDGFTIRGNDGTGTTIGNTNLFIGPQLGNVVVKNNRILIGKRDLIVDGEDSIGLLTTGTTVPSQFTSSLTVENNIIGMVATGLARRAYYVNPGVTSYIFQGNTVTGNFDRTAVTQARDSLIDNNTVTGTGGTWGLTVWDGGSASYNQATFTNNSFSGLTRGIWIYSTSNVTVRGNSLIGNTNGVEIFGSSPTNINLSFNRIVGNLTAGVNSSATAIVNAENNWWGCNYGPAATGPGCSGVTNGTIGSVDADPWLVLTTSAAAPSVVVGGTDLVTSGLTTNSNNVTPGGGFVLNGTPATYVATLGTAPSPTGTTSGVTTTLFTAGGTPGFGGVATTVDGQTVSAPIAVIASACSAVSTAPVSTLTGVGISIPVTTDNMDGRGAISADFVFDYNNAVLTPKVVAVLAGPVAGGGAVVTFRTPTSPIPSPAGTVIVSVVNPAGFTGAGALVTMEFDVIGVIGSTSILDIDPIAGFTDDQLFNGGYLQCNTINSTALLTVISGTVSGQVTYGNAPVGPPIPVRGVLLDAPGSPNVSDITDAGGLYSMSGFGPGSYIITASKTAYPVGTSIPAHGIFADDATAIVQHVVGLVPITNPSQLAAAKVSGIATPALSSFDAALISQWIVAISSPVNQTGQWKLTPPSQPSTVYTANATQNYTALLMGDVNQSWNNDPLSRPALTEATKNSVLPSITSMEAEKGREVIVPFRIDNLGGKSVGSYQFDIEFDPEVIEPVTVAADVMGTMSEGLTVISNSPEPGLLKVAAYGALPASGDGVYVNLKFRTIGAVGSTTQVSIREFMFNDGSDEVFVKSGRVSVTRESDDMGIKGRVISALGQPVSKARVTLTATDGTTRTTVASSLGSYEFSGLTAGETYTVTVSAKRFTFESRSVSMTGSTVDLDMIARQ